MWKRFDRKKYLNTEELMDNFYVYKTDIKECLRQMRDDEEWIEKIRERARATGDTGEDVLELLDMIERGFEISSTDFQYGKEHSKYVRATVTRLNYLLSGESDTKGLVIQLLNRMSEDDYEEVIPKDGGEDESVFGRNPVRKISL